MPHDKQPGAGKRVFAVRHAPTGTSGVCVGDADVPCTISAREAASRVLSLVGSHAFASVWSSPRERCLAPASLLAEKLDVPLRVDDRLREISLGRWQMRSWKEIETSEPQRFKSWTADWLSQSPPEGELPGKLLERVCACWDEMAQGDHLLIGHAGVIRALRVLLNGSSWTDAMGIEVNHLEGEWFPEKGRPGREK